MSQIPPYFTERRSCRTFSDRPVTPELLHSLLEAAAHAPTTGNMQLYSVIITRDEANRQALASYHFSQPATKAPVMLTFCADFNRFTRWCLANDADAGYDNLQGFMTAMLDTMCLAQQFCTIAEMHGLGTVYLGTTLYNAKPIARFLGLPALCVPIITVALGWPASQPCGEDVGRLPAEAFIHTERYAAPSEKRLAELYAEKEARPDSRAFVAENGKQNLAQVFTDVRYPRTMMEQFSGILADFLREQGFDPEGAPGQSATRP